MNNTPIAQDLVLLGGGHAHALLISYWRMQPTAGIRLTLVSPEMYTPYSGMLPGLMAGLYSFEQAHIDLDRLCSAAGVRFIRAACTGLDLEAKKIRFADRPALEFDLLSINTGASPSLSVPGSAQFSLPVKPISALYPRWLTLLERLHANPSMAIAVVGGGAAAVEICAALRARAPKAQLALFFPEQQPLPGYGASFRTKMQRQLERLRVKLFPDHAIARVEPNLLIDQRDNSHAADEIFWCTNASAAPWFADSGLALDPQGFIQVNQHLQSTSHDNVFVAGDAAALVDQPRPKAGVFAVRQAPVLFNNLIATLLKQPLRAYRAQASFLSILSLGDGSAMATRANGVMPTLSGRWVWRWKDRIDRKFMAMFSALAPMPAQQASSIAPALWRDGDDAAPPLSELAMRCGGCGAKVGADILSKVVAELETVNRPEVLIGLDDPDDAAALRFDADTTIVQSVDQFRAIIDDPFLQGQIAAHHALSDLHAMHASPHSAQALVTLPFARDAITARDLSQLMAGALKVLNAENCQLTGGHTSEGLEASMGFAVNGIANTRMLTKAGLEVGDHLILTQPLGTGALFAARARGFSQGPWIAQALFYMAQSNRAAADILHAKGAHACTDVTGFGLAGHLMEMLKASHLSARLTLDAIPLLDGALACVTEGITSSLQPHNLRLQAGIEAVEQQLAKPRVQLLFDPQTSGGLLAGLPANQAAGALAALIEAGYNASVIGKVTPAAKHLVSLKYPQV
ncbi:selenide, water dikinase SelD [Simiduia curdlanivorans]|uniref:Selenide, water dikinase SelD n=1 Tax=Simiduia curdlanivorans TaxID=1492769 RepID=A0ABV8V3U8_9GAMM|nr:selenide, water dikinase SelD [Simiduia curdlanivorans]MDN3638170.1 selenide, water dikinase SelD [Simiduia curdlanivorans]